MISLAKRCRGPCLQDNLAQKPAYGLYIEELNGTPFTAPRDSNRRTWTYRIRPTVLHKPFVEIPSRLIRSGPFNEVAAPPNQLRWRPLSNPAPGTDFIDGIVTLGGSGDAATQEGTRFMYMRRTPR